MMALVLLVLALPSAATADPTYSVMNADGGIYWRSAPDWNTPVAIAGNGVYNGSIVALHCYQSGTSVPGSADTMWEQATVVGGPGTGSGWLNEHFINDGQPINQPSPGVPACGSSPAPPPPPDPGPTPPPGDGFTFGIYNADGGIYYRSSPHWSDTPQTVGVGVYNGDQVRLICGASGDPVGPGNNTAWSYVTNLTRNVGNGWVSEHFINDGLQPGQWPSGLPQCGSDIPGAIGSANGGGTTPNTGGGSGGGSASQFGRSLYFSPFARGQDVRYGNRLTSTSPASVTRYLDQWDPTAKQNICPPPSDSVPAGNTAGITTLAAWSEGRSGPLLFLQAHPSWYSQIHYILLFDPGNRREYANSQCGKKYDFSGLLATWLKSNSANRLVVLSGEVTYDRKHPTATGLLHAGIQEGLFPRIKTDRNQTIRRHVIVCNYDDNMTHEGVWLSYQNQMNMAPISGLGDCPAIPNTNGLVHVPSWNP
jgi:hypothetical protein